MRSRFYSAALAFALVGCAETGVPSEGFKDIHYGMNLDQLRRLGFDCRPDQTSCTRAPGVGNSTLFGKEALVSVETRNGQVARIEVTVTLPANDTLSLLRRNFGATRRLELRNRNGQQMGIYIWQATNGTSIAVPDYGLAGRSVVQFNDAAVTRELLQTAPVSEIDPTDI